MRRTNSSALDFFAENRSIQAIITMDKGPVAGRKVWTRLAQGFGRGEHKAAAGAGVHVASRIQRSVALIAAAYRPSAGCPRCNAFPTSQMARKALERASSTSS